MSWWESLARPQRTQVVDRFRDPSDPLVGRVGDAHLREPERKARPEAEHHSTGSHLVERAYGHRQHYGMTGERIKSAQPDSDPIHVRRERRAVSHRVALEVGIVHPD